MWVRVMVVVWVELEDQDMDDREGWVGMFDQWFVKVV